MGWLILIVMAINFMQVLIIQKVEGHITLKSSNPYDYPKIQFNYLEHEDDLKQTIECIHVARKILGQNSLKAFCRKRNRTR
jgi:choline dehydrogenase-like flavoprotein